MNKTMIFSFGTLRQEAVQESLFGRTVPTSPDSLEGWRIGEMRVPDPAVIEVSGTDIHPALVPGNPRDVVHGVLLHVTQRELDAADLYEKVSYKRIGVRLQSGREAWVYVPHGATLG